MGNFSYRPDMLPALEKAPRKGATRGPIDNEVLCMAAADHPVGLQSVVR